MDRSKGRHMATTEESLSELLDQLNTRTIEDPRMSDWSWQGQPIEPFTSHSIGTSDPYYGAVPSVTIGGISATGINISPTVWTQTTSNTGGYTFANTQCSNTVHIRGEDSDLLIDDKSLKIWMEKVEERLNILTPNPELEKEWDDLKKLGDRYRKLEKKCQEKANMWKKLKSMPRPDLP